MCSCGISAIEKYSYLSVLLFAVDIIIVIIASVTVTDVAMCIR